MTTEYVRFVRCETCNHDIADQDWLVHVEMCSAPPEVRYFEQAQAGQPIEGLRYVRELGADEQKARGLIMSPL